MRKIVRASVLALALCGSAFAGDIPNPPVAPPPPQASTVAEDGQMETPQASEDSLTEIMLTLLSGVLSLL